MGSNQGAKFDTIMFQLMMLILISCSLFYSKSWKREMSVKNDTSEWNEETYLVPLDLKTRFTFLLNFFKLKKEGEKKQMAR